MAYPRAPNQNQTVKIDRPVAIRTEDAATRFARPYMLAKIYALKPGAIAELITADLNRSCGSVRTRPKDPNQRWMQQQRHGANKTDRTQISLRAVLNQHSAQREQGSGQRCSADQAQRIVNRNRYREIRDIHNEAQSDTQDQCVFEHRGQNRTRENSAAFAAVTHELHDRHADAIAKRCMEGDDGIVSSQIFGPIGAFGNWQSE